MTDPVSSTMAIPYPTGTDLVSAGPAAMEAIANTVDAAVPLGFGDLVVPGVVGVADGTVANPAVSVVGAVSYTGLTAGNAWVALSSGALVRNVIPTGSLSSTPGSLPATGKYAVVGIDLIGTPGWGSAATVGLSSKGADETSQALAIANPPAVASGHFRLLDVVILNTAGTYSLSTLVDRRTYAATGGWQAITLSANMVNGGLTMYANTYFPSVGVAGNVVRLRGVINNGTGSTTTDSTVWGTVPVAARPADQTRNCIVNAAGTPTALAITTSGQIIAEEAVANSASLIIEGGTYSL